MQRIYFGLGKTMIFTKRRNRKFTTPVSEVMTIQILFHLSGYREFQSFYLGYIQKFMKEYFPKTVTYSRMVELKKRIFMPMSIFLKSDSLSYCTGISFVDSTPLRVCHNKRIHQHKTFNLKI
ncbi:transposase [Chryseobacterium cucumeris]